MNSIVQETTLYQITPCWPDDSLIEISIGGESKVAQWIPDDSMLEESIACESKLAQWLPDDSVISD